METKKMLTILLLAGCLILWAGQLTMAGPVGTAFTYQGRLIDANNAADGLYDFQFKLFDANSDGNQLGSNVNKSEVDVIDGYFTVELDFGSVFDGNKRWLDIGVRLGELEDPNVYTVLSPRQKITPTPYALYALTGGSGGDSLWQMSGSDIYYSNGNVGIGTTSPSALAKLDVVNHDTSDEAAAVRGEATCNYFGIQNYGGYFTAAGASGRGIYGVATGDYGMGVYGVADNNGHTSNYGGHFEAAGTSGRGVRGVASNSGNYTNFGGFFEAAGSTGRGVHCYASGTNGMGVYGEASNSSGNHTNYGGYFSAAGTSGMGVYGKASNTGSVTNCGGYFTAAGEGGRGVHGVASNSNDNSDNIGGYFVAQGGYGRAVYGEATNSNYTNYGGYFVAQGYEGRGVYGEATSSRGGMGVYGVAPGTSGWGVYGSSAGDLGRGVVGLASNPGYFINYGGHFTAAGGEGKGVYGYASNTGNSTNYGGYFEANGGTGRGVYGRATGSNGVGVYGSAPGGGKAGYFSGDVHITGNVTKAYTVGTSDLAMPIAYACINSNGSVASGTPNVSSTWDATDGRYEITIDGEIYYFASYVTVVTPCTLSAVFATTNSMSNQLLVYLRNLSGTSVQGAFQFVTYKP